MHVTILLLGITGNVAKLKVLPGINDFALTNPENSVDLVGYSRSLITEAEVASSLSPDKPHALRSILLRTGEYQNISVFQDLVSTLAKDAKLIVYLAVPPSVYTDFIAALPESLPSNIVILIEKPFGENLVNLQAISKIITEKHLEKNILFLDHYLFKNGLTLRPTPIHASSISSVTVKAIETVGVEDRLGYYSTTGAVQDMFVHLLNLIRTELSILSGKPSNFPSALIVNTAILGQYESVETELPANIPTYFDIHGTLQFESLRLPFRFVSGKKLNKKKTVSTFKTSNTSVTWEINPKIELKEGRVKYQVGNTSSDHQNIFEQVVGEQNGFLHIQEALEISRLEESLLNQTKHTKMIVYPDNSTVPDITRLATKV